MRMLSRDIRPFDPFSKVLAFMASSDQPYLLELRDDGLTGQPTPSHPTWKTGQRGTAAERSGRRRGGWVQGQFSFCQIP
jgi:hypothetical protein